MSTRKLLKNTTDELEKVLKQEIELYTNYADALIKDTEFMSALKVEDLEKNNKHKNTILLKMKALDQARQNLIRQFAASKALNVQEVKLLDVCAHMDKVEADRLKKLREELQTVVSRLQKVQHQTATLAQTSLGWVNSTIATLQKMLSPAGTYNLQGKIGQEGTFAGRVVERQA